jgi:hypothetical protein
MMTHDSTTEQTGNTGHGRSAQIRRLNDDLRRNGTGGLVVTTPGLASFGAEYVAQVRQAVAVFEAFTPDNDPWGDHDCAVMTVGAERVLWKIDYYDLALTAHSPDPTDPRVTTRVLTIMLAEEY